MGNGFPVGAVLIHPQITAKKEMLGTTFGGNYLACAAAISVLEVIRKENLMRKAYKTGAYLKDQLLHLNQIKDVRGAGLMIAIDLHEPCAPIRKDLLFTHHIFTGSASNKHTIRILPPLTLREKDVDRFVQALKKSLNQPHS